MNGSNGEPVNRRNAARHPLDAEVLLVTPGEDGPVVRTGRSVEVSAGGCSVRLDEPLGDSAPSGVLVVRAAGTEMTMLSGPVRTDPGEPHVVGLRFVPPTEHDDTWPEFVGSLPTAE
jgi:hypothetical protein